jgi:hypothetical protein
MVMDSKGKGGFSFWRFKGRVNMQFIKGRQKESPPRKGFPLELMGHKVYYTQSTIVMYSSPYPNLHNSGTLYLS